MIINDNNNLFPWCIVWLLDEQLKRKRRFWQNFAGEEKPKITRIKEQSIQTSIYVPSGEKKTTHQMLLFRLGVYKRTNFQVFYIANILQQKNTACSNEKVISIFRCAKIDT